MRNPQRAIVLVTITSACLIYRAGFCARAVAGRIVKSGSAELALELEQHGYGWIDAENATRKVAWRG